MCHDNAKYQSVESGPQWPWVYNSEHSGYTVHQALYCSVLCDRDIPFTFSILCFSMASLKRPRSDLGETEDISELGRQAVSTLNIKAAAPCLNSVILMLTETTKMWMLNFEWTDSAARERAIRLLSTSQSAASAVVRAATGYGYSYGGPSVCTGIVREIWSIIFTLRTLKPLKLSSCIND